MPLEPSLHWGADVRVTLGKYRVKFNLGLKIFSQDGGTTWPQTLGKDTVEFNLGLMLFPGWLKSATTSPGTDWLVQTHGGSVSQLEVEGTVQESFVCHIGV